MVNKISTADPWPRCKLFDPLLRSRLGHRTMIRFLFNIKRRAEILPRNFARHIGHLMRKFYEVWIVVLCHVFT